MKYDEKRERKSGHRSALNSSRPLFLDHDACESVSEQEEIPFIMVIQDFSFDDLNENERKELCSLYKEVESVTLRRDQIGRKTLVMECGISSETEKGEE